MQRKKVLVISNNCFSLSNSNGRTLGNLFVGWPKSDLAQFCVIAQDPNWELCDNYYCLEDKTVLKSFIKCQKAVGRRLLNQQTNNSSNTMRASIGRKTLYKVAARELIWAGRRWYDEQFKQWLDDFNPDQIVFQFGDSIFMFDIALFIAKTRNLPLIIYNTEGYYFFPRNWHQKALGDTLLFKLYKRKYRKKVESMMQIASHCIYLNDKLKEDYDKTFNVQSTVIYNSCSISKSDEPLFANNLPRISYLGNLGLDRDSALIEIGSVLQELNEAYNIDIYGQADENMQQRFINAPGVNYKGLISYDEVRAIISNSDILFHVETEKGYQERQLQYAFTTKIADSLASGRCFIVYAPEHLACSQYVINHKCGWLATNRDELYEALCYVIRDKKQRIDTLKNAVEVAVLNHDLIKNASKFQEILLTI